MTAYIASLRTAQPEQSVYPEFWTTQNIADHVGLTRQRIHQLAAEPGFPAPAFTLTTRPKHQVRVWAADVVRRWALTRDRQRRFRESVPPAAQVVAPEIVVDLSKERRYEKVRHPFPALMPAAQVAELFDMRLDCLYRLVRTNSFPLEAVRVGRSIRFRGEDVAKLLGKSAEVIA